MQFSKRTSYSSQHLEMSPGTLPLPQSSKRAGRSSKMLLAIPDAGLEGLWRWSYTPAFTMIADFISPASDRATLYFYVPVTHPTTAIINVSILFQNKHVDGHLQSGKWKFSICLWRNHLVLKTKNLAKEFNLWLLCNTSVQLDPKRSVFFFSHLLESVKFLTTSPPLLSALFRITKQNG